MRTIWFSINKQGTRHKGDKTPVQLRDLVNCGLSGSTRLSNFKVSRTVENALAHRIFQMSIKRLGLLGWTLLNDQFNHSQSGQVAIESKAGDLETWGSKRLTPSACPSTSFRFL
eukprot:Gregarina_sp_Poly_1__3694@NODE_2090_length_2702_cov_27_982543_g1349_i0_p3_GENE_NODE_2090_length_2702_cov_27_982543_g1349_i0NODE_2090_length_2702_cov_27_982543_g1349_i0_p3_ORF_typecomplete_len114_score4_27_NODE_2090_length_2702_cov_27_982543_g1349_i023252666